MPPSWDSHPNSLPLYRPIILNFGFRNQKSLKKLTEPLSPSSVEYIYPKEAYWGTFLHHLISKMSESVISNLFLFDDTKVARSIRNLVDALQLQEDFKRLEN